MSILHFEKNKPNIQNSASSSDGPTTDTGSPVVQKINKALEEKGVQMPLNAPLKETCEKHLKKFENLKANPSGDDGKDLLDCFEFLNNFQRELGQHPLSQEIRDIASTLYNKGISESLETIFTCVSNVLETEKAKKRKF